MSSKEMVISANRHETKVAILEDDLLVEAYFQRANEYSLAGSIYKGRVTRVLPGMQSAFVDLGLERDTFLYVSDFLEEHEDIDKITGEERPPREHRGERRQQRGPQPAVQAAPVSVQEQAAAGEAAAAHAEPPAAQIAEGAPAEARAESRPAEQRAEERGERRGRRRRRRRGGKGFPESKYATEAVSAPLAAGAIEETEAEGEEEQAPAPVILPGESLAKYRGVAARPPESEEAARPEELEEKASEAAISASGAAPLIAPVVEEVENEYDEPIHYPPENALPDAPVHEIVEEPGEPAASEAISGSRTPAPVMETPIGGSVSFAMAEPVQTEKEEQPEPPGTAGEQALVQEAGADEEETAPAVASLLDEEEDRDIQAMILGDIEGIEIEPIEEGEGSDESAEEAKAVEAEGVERESGSAEVRERGAHYPHRVSRRRRRGRGGDRGQGQEVRTESRGERQERTIGRPNTQQPSISDLLKEGQEIIVQIAKEPLGQKGARITSHVALPGRYVVYMPTLEHMGVSRKIGSEEERLRLKRILQSKRPGPVGGYITRTAAEGRTEDEIAADMQFLYTLWQDIKAKAEKRPAPALLHHDLDIVQRILRDQLGDTFKAIWIDNEEMYENVVRFVERFQPSLVGKVKLYTRDVPIFDAFNITNELEKALRPKVWLKSGGYIVINQTEALVAIDVNTGKFVGKSNRLEDTIVKTNTEAIKEIVRQIRLRDLGGIIVIDFIDMDERKNRQKVMQALEEAMRVDRAPYKILQFNDFGLVAITRKRVKQSLERTLCSPCPHCEGAGYVKSVQTVVGEILTEARKMAKTVEGKDVVLRVNPEVAKLLKSHQNKYLEELEEILRRPVLVRSDPQLHQEKFDLA